MTTHPLQKVAEAIADAEGDVVVVDGETWVKSEALVAERDALKAHVDELVFDVQIAQGLAGDAAAYGRRAEAAESALADARREIERLREVLRECTYQVLRSGTVASTREREEGYYLRGYLRQIDSVARAALAPGKTGGGVMSDGMNDARRQSRKTQPCECLDNERPGYVRLPGSDYFTPCPKCHGHCWVEPEPKP